MSSSSPALRDRLWVLGVALVPWLVQPGLIQPDTKVNLTVNPWGYLARATAAWNPQSGLGEVQNQAYGYLFPMGPFFGLGQSLGLPEWAVQRLWWTLLVVVAFTGARRLIRLWGIGGATASAIGALAYAFSPRVLTLLSAHSVEAWPLAVAPWLVVVADRWIHAADRTTRWATFARFGLLVTALGGVNAVASAAAVLPAFLWLCVQRDGLRRVHWLLGASVAGAFWWIVPLLVLGRYAYPFLDYIETASITTATTSVPNTLRGSQNWVAYILDDQSHPVWQGGWVAAQSLWAIVLGCTLVAVALWGITLLDGHARRFAVLAVVLGTVAMAVGHPGVAGSVLADPVRGLLDGPLSPLRNVHKLDLLVRLPVALGLAAAVAHLARLPRRDLLQRRAAAAGVGALVVASFVPLWQGRVGDPSAYRAIPQSWQRAADRIEQETLPRHAAGKSATTLLLPSSRTASYTWGRSTDEPLGAMLRTPTVVRASAPLGNPGVTRLLDQIDASAATGAAQPELAPTLSRMGIRVVAVRKDLDPSAGAGDWKPVERTLATSPGIRRMPGTSDEHRSLWIVDQEAASTSTEGPVLRAGAQALPAALALGLVDQRTAMRTTDGPEADVVTDSLPWRVYHNGVAPQVAYGPVLPLSDDAPDRAGARDLPPLGDRADHTHRVLRGLRSFTVSSEASDPFAEHYRDVRASRWSAIDDDPATAWYSGDGETTARLRLELARPAPAGEVRIRFATGRGVVTPERVTVNGRSVVVPRTGEPAVSVPVSTGTTTLDIELHSGAADDVVLGISDLRLTGVRWGSVIALPDRVDARSTAVLLGADGAHPGVPARLGEDSDHLRRQVVFSTGGRLDGTVRLAGHGDLPTTCGAAGMLRVGTASVRLKVDRVVPGGVIARTCAPVDVQDGAQIVRVDPPTGWVTRESLLRPAGKTFAAGADLALTGQGANPGWTASEGSTLQPVTVDGWQQAFRVESSPQVHPRFAPTTVHRVGLVAGLVLVLGLVVLALATRRTDKRGATTHVTCEPAARPVVLCCASVTGFLVAGPVGVLSGLGAGLVPRRHRPDAMAAAMVVAGIALALGGVVDARSWGAAVGQVLGTFSLALLSTWLPDGVRRSAPAPAARRA